MRILMVGVPAGSSLFAAHGVRMPYLPLHYFKSAFPEEDLHIVDPDWYPGITEDGYLEEILAQVRNLEPDIVGLSVSSASAIEQAAFIAEEVMLNRPGILVSFGGPGCNRIVSGYRWLERHFGLKAAPVRGGVIRERTVIDYRLGSNYGFNTAMIPASTGCRNNCSFCSAGLLNWEPRIYEDVVFEVISASQATNIRYIEFTDNSFPAYPFAEYLVEGHLEGKPYGFLSDLTGPWPTKFWDAIKDTNLKNVVFGVESLDPTVLDMSGKCRKDNTFFHFHEALAFEFDDCSTIAFLMYGLPGQTADSFRSDVERLQSAGVRVIPSCLQLMAGTNLAVMVERQGDLWMLDGEGCVIQSPWMSWEEVEKLDDMAAPLVAEAYGHEFRALKENDDGPEAGD